MGIRSKISLLLVGLLLVVLGAAGFLQARLVEKLALEEMTRRGTAMLAALSVPCAVALANNEIERLDDYLIEFSPQVQQPGEETAILPGADLLSLAVLDNRGRVLAHTRETEFGRVMHDDFTRRAIAAEGRLVEKRSFEGQEVLLLALPVRSGLRWGTLEARFSLARMQAEVARLRLKALGISALAVVLALAGLWLGLWRLVIRPVDRLEKAAGSLRCGEFDCRVEVTGKDELSRLAQAFNQAADQLGRYTHELEDLVKERSEEIIRKNRELEDANRQLELLAITDGLTGLYNKRHWLERVGGFEIIRARRGGHRLSVLMLDVDHFKHYNDRQGHLAGDRALKRITELLKENLRLTDIPGRFGGEEFCVALLDTDLKAARQVAEKIRRVVEGENFPGGEEQPGGRLTVSIGVAELDRERDRLEDLLQRADEALYRAKEKGRNRVET